MEAYTEVWRQYTERRDAMLEVLKSELDVNDNRPIYVTGHSLGGAVAAINSLDLKILNYNLQGTYTSAQPILGDHVVQGLLSYHLANRYFRLIRTDDIVPRVPPTAALDDLFDDIFPHLGLGKILRKLAYSHHAGIAYLANEGVKASPITASVRDHLFWSEIKSKFEQGSFIETVLGIVQKQKSHSPLEYLCSLDEI